MIIKQINIKNFKGISDLSLKEFQKINQVIGENGAGKTSLNEAIRFLFVGTGRDAHKIKEGKKFSEVSATLQVRGQDIEISKHLSSDGKCSTNLCVDGKWHKQTQSALIKELFGLSSFNPEDITSKESRVKVFSSLIKDKFVYPEEVKIYQKELDFRTCEIQINENENPIEALQKIRHSLISYRTLVGRDKKHAELSEAQSEKQLQTENIELEKFGFDIEKLESEEELIKQKVELQHKISKVRENKDKLSVANSYKNAIKEKIIKTEAELKSLYENLKDRSEEIKELNTLVEEASEVPQDLYDKISASKKKKQCKEIKDMLLHYRRRTETQRIKYKKINKFLQEDFIKLFSKYIDPIKEKVNGIDFKEGDWLYKGVSIDNLSRAETLDLALKLIEAQDRDSNIVCIDNAEMFDKETIKKLSLNKEGTSFILMKVGKEFDIESKVIKANGWKNEQKKD